MTRLLPIGFLDLFDADHSAENHFSAPCVVRFFDAAIAADDASCGKSGPGITFMISSIVAFGLSRSKIVALIKLVQDCAEEYLSPSRRQYRKNHCKEVGKFRGENGRLFLRFVVVGNHFDSFFIEVFHQLHRSMCQTRFGITHRSWRVAVDRTEVSLPIDERVAHRPVLRHTH